MSSEDPVGFLALLRPAATHLDGYTLKGRGRYPPRAAICRGSCQGVPRESGRVRSHPASSMYGSSLRLPVHVDSVDAKAVERHVSRIHEGTANRSPNPDRTRNTPFSTPLRQRIPKRTATPAISSQETPEPKPRPLQ